MSKRKKFYVFTQKRVHVSDFDTFMQGDKVEAVHIFHRGHKH